MNVGCTIIGKDRYGCATRRGKGTCTNSHTIMRQRIEARVIDGLRDHMLTPDLMEIFVSAFEAELTALQGRAGSERTRLTRDLGAVERRLAGVMRAIEDGAWNDSLRSRLNELEQTKAAITAQLRVHDAPRARVHFLPNAAAIYRERVATVSLR